MILILHRFTAIIATACIITFFASTISVELFGSFDSIAQIKSLIVTPGLFVLIPAIAITGATGFLLSKKRKGKIVEDKKKRMPFIAINGLLILLPAAIVLDLWASSGNFDSNFYILQTFELIAGATNGVLMILNIRDGRKLTRKKSFKE